jgi:hypothetical protein
MINNDKKIEYFDIWTMLFDSVHNIDDLIIQLKDIKRAQNDNDPKEWDKELNKMIDYIHLIIPRPTRWLS